MIGDVLASRLDDVLRCELQAVSKMLEANCKRFGHFVTLLMKMVEWKKQVGGDESRFSSLRPWVAQICDQSPRPSRPSSISLGRVGTLR
jgi:hypothetical protein